MSNTLIALQTRFQDYILGQDARALDLIESTPALSAARRLDIYHNAFRARLAELLADTFERVLRYIGDDAFERAAWDFVESHTPTARNLRDYGSGFPAYLAARFADDSDVAELAEMDWCLRNTFDAPDADALRAADLAAIPPDAWDALTFRLHPTVSFLVFHWNTPLIWQHLNEETAPPPAERAAQAHPWLFWRKTLQPHFRSLAPEEHVALLAIAAGSTFGEVCGLLAEAYPQLDVAPRIGGWLRCWLDDDLLRKPD